MEQAVNNRYEKKAKSSTALYKLFHVLGAEKGRLILSVCLSILGTIFTLASPLMLKQVSELILNCKTVPIDYSKLWLYAGLTIGLLALGGLFQILQTNIVVGVIARASEKLRNAMIKKINSLPLNYFDTRDIGDVLSYVSNDVDLIGTTLNQVIATSITAIITIIGSIIILFVLNWKIGLTAVGLLPIILIILSRISGASEKYFHERNKKTAEVSAKAEEAYTGFNILRVFNANQRNRDKFSETNFSLEKSMNKADFYSGISIPATTFLGNLLFCAIALVGGVIVAQTQSKNGDTVDVEGIATIVAAVSYGDQLISPMTSIATTMATLQQTIASAKRIFDFLEQENEPDESNKTITLDQVKGNVSFEHVQFGYTKDRVIIHDFSEVGLPGQKIAIVGPTGAGKTTMVNLLMRFYELNSGSIKIEGIDTKTMNRSYVRSLFGMVLQDTWLFEGTIMENLKYSRPNATDEEVYAACKATHCDSFIRQQPNGYQQVLNEDCGLSAGQKQLLTIARAMIQNAPMLILDEATSSVDTRTELQIQEAMDALMKNRTSFVIAHRLSTIKNSNLIIVMKDGDVIETGNHDELMKQNGFYASLYNAQFTGNGPQFS